MAEILQEQYSIPAEDFTNPARESPVLYTPTYLGNARMKSSPSAESVWTHRLRLLDLQ